MVTKLDKKMSKLGRNLIDELEHDMIVNKSAQTKEVKLLNSPQNKCILNVEKVIE